MVSSSRMNPDLFLISSARTLGISSLHIAIFSSKYLPISKPGAFFSLGGGITPSANVRHHWRRKRGGWGGFSPPKVLEGGAEPPLSWAMPITAVLQKNRFGMSHHVKFHE